MVLGVVGALAGLVKSQSSSTKVDSKVFQLHYRWTTALLFGSAAFLAATEYFGDPITCIDNDPAVKTYCWIKGIYTVDSNLAHKDVNPYAAHGSNHYGLGPDEGKEKTYHQYYQWVPIILFLQGCMFYLPHLLWKMNEGNHIKNLLQGLQFIKLDDQTDEKITKIVKYILNSKGKNWKYFIIYNMFEVLNLVNVIGQMFLIDKVLNNSFSDFGTKAFRDTQVDINDRTDILIKVFPRISKCMFKKYGPSGNIINEDTVCILPQNLLNEKIFTVMWFWFWILTVITSINIVIKLVVILSKKVRVFMFDLKGRLSRRKDIAMMVESMSHANFFLLIHLRMNLNYYSFEQLLLQMEKENDYNPLHNPNLPLHNKEDMMMDTLNLKKKNYGSNQD